MFRDTVIAILATIAKQEHARLSERVVAGLRRAKREGKVLGRKRIIVDREKIRTMHATGQSVRAIAAEVGVSKSLVANIVSRAFRTLSPKPLSTADNASLIQYDLYRAWQSVQALSPITCFWEATLRRLSRCVARQPDHRPHLSSNARNYRCR